MSPRVGTPIYNQNSKATFNLTITLLNQPRQPTFWTTVSLFSKMTEINLLTRTQRRNTTWATLSAPVAQPRMPIVQ